MVTTITDRSKDGLQSTTLTVHYVSRLPSDDLRIRRVHPGRLSPPAPTPNWGGSPNLPKKPNPAPRRCNNGSLISAGGWPQITSRMCSIQLASVVSCGKENVGKLVDGQSQSELGMKKQVIGKVLVILAAFGSFLFSVGLWFSGQREEGLFVGIWVPSILSFGSLLFAGRAKP